MIKPPCKGCKNRYSLCHTTCTEYIAFQETLKREKQAKADSRRNDYEMYGYKQSIFKKQGSYKWG